MADEQTQTELQPQKQEQPPAPAPKPVAERPEAKPIELPDIGEKAAAHPLAKVALTDIEPAKVFRLDAGAIWVIQELLCKGASDVEVAWFLYQCRALGLNPLLPGQIAFSAYTDKHGNRKRLILIEIGGMRNLAMRTERYRQGDPPVLTFNDKGIPETCTVSLYERVDGQWVKHERTFQWREFAAFHGKDLWQSMPGTMFAKACEAALIRFYFADGLAGVYTFEEAEAPEVTTGFVPPPKPKPAAATKPTLTEEQAGIREDIDLLMRQVAKAAKARGEKEHKTFAQRFMLAVAKGKPAAEWAATDVATATVAVTAYEANGELPEAMRKSGEAAP